MEKSDEIFKISKDAARARDLIDMAKERLHKIIKLIPESIPYKILEEYYEIAVQLMTSVMYSEGYKTLSHIALIKFLSNHSFKYNEIKTLDNMRKFRHGIVYYGRKEGGNFYINHKEEIKEIIEKLVNLAEKLSN
ncbi:MAG: hypothetical protein AABW93_03750 [Nanoarchaeota archaeon]